MPKFIPKIPDSFNGSIGEEKAFDALRLLDNSYTIFHSLNWVGISNRTQGEADFVIIHPAKGILVVEVKSGGIRYKDGDWIQTNTITGFSKKIAPFSQARRSQYEILERLQLSLCLSRPPLICHAVWFPSIEVKPTDKLPPDAPKEVVFDEVTLNEAQKAIDDAFKYWMNKTGIRTSLNSLQLKEVIDNLAPYFRAVPGMRSIIEEAEQSYIRLTDQQAMLLDYLEEQKTAVIHGLAGTGKTVLAKEKAKRLADEGGNVLFLCYNSFLKEYLRQNFSQPGIAFHNVHSLAAEILNYKNIGFDEMLDELEEYLMLMEPNDWPYNHVVIDEGQDLNEGLVNLLDESIKAKGGNFYIFYDKNQYVMKNQVPDWIEKAECKLVLHRNCRNTAEVHKTACSLIAVDTI
ncbi:MAG: NERD domain-containing protein, partial [Fermentimonas sp.]|nr:NERD domain-containing protein [Fermentimonas sp.]